MYKAQIIHIVSFMPEKVIDNDVFYNKLSKDEEALANEKFFRGVKQRHFASPDYTSAELGIHVLNKLLKQTDFDAKKLDLIICCCVFNDYFWPGIGSAIQSGVLANQASIMHLDTSCASFLTSLNTATAFIEAGRYQHIAVVSVTNYISRLSEFQHSIKSSVLGDGAIAALVSRSKNASIISRFERSYGEHYGLLHFESSLNNDELIPYWERNSGAISVKFNQEMIEKIRTICMQTVPNACKQCLAQANMDTNDVNLLITHQPNQAFLDEWRKRINILPPRTHDTLSKHGNLFHGSVAVSWADAVENNILKKEDILLLGTFSNGGDFVSAMLVRW